MNREKKVSIVAPFFNEEDGVHFFCEKLAAVVDDLADRYDFELICINDGSADSTVEHLKSLVCTYPFLKIIDLSRNFGKEAALTAGLDYAKGDVVITMDSDLQHPPELIKKMLRMWESGFEIVLPRRNDRRMDGFLYRLTATAFYRVSNAISDVRIPAEVGDFRLMDRKVVDAVNRLEENCRFMKGIFSWVGFTKGYIDYDVDVRQSGKSKFNIWKLWNFAIEGIVSFSSFPLRVWSYIGAFVALMSFIYAGYLIIQTMLFGVKTPGYASLMVVILFLAGVQLIGIGVLGEYLSRVFLEVKKRPTYIIKEIIE